MCRADVGEGVIALLLQHTDETLADAASGEADAASSEVEGGTLSMDSAEGLGVATECT